MAERKRVILLAIIMAVIALAIGGMSISVLYKTAFEEQRARLTEAAQSQARLMEAVARFDRRFSQYAHPQGAAAATISQIIDAHEQYRGFGRTGEFTLARREGDQIVFLLSHRHHDLDMPNPVTFDGIDAEPMRRALSGRSGTVIGLDYRGVAVLAAHEPVAELDLGIVAKIDMAEIRAPFLQAGLAVAVLSLVLIAAGAALFVRVSNPIIETLRESEKKHRSLFETMAQGVVYQDASGSITSANPAAESLLGMSLDQMQGRTSIDPRWKAIHEDGSEFTGETHPGPIAQKTGEEVLGVVMGVFNPKEDDYRWINIDAIPQFRNGEDKPFQTFAMFSDITERRQAEKALADSEIRWRSVTEESPDHVMLLDTNLIIEYINFTAPGISKGQVIGTPITKFFPEAEAAEYERTLRTAIKTGTPASYESQRPTPTGVMLYYESRVVPRYIDGTVIGLTIHARDITERKKAEAGRRRQALVWEQMSDGVMVLDGDGRVLDWNPAAEVMFGYPIDEMLGKTSTILHRKKAAETTVSKITNGISRDGYWSGEIDIVRKDGSEGVVETRVLPFHDENGNLIGRVGVNRDITERKRAEEKTRELEAEIAHIARISVMGEMATTLAHELNQPMTVISGGAELCGDLLRSGKADPQQLLSTLDQMVEQARRASSIIRRVRSFVGKGQNQRRTEDINAVIGEVSELMRVDCRRNKVALVFSPGKELPPVLADAVQIQQVVINLVRNGIDALGKGSSPPRKVMVSTTNDGGDVVEVEVRDTGEGIPAEALDRVFEPFFSTTRDGMGMGLPICRTIIEAHQGKLWTEADGGGAQGAVFKFTLPSATDVRFP